MEILTVVLCGIFLGGANVVPGVSGGTVAVLLGIYEKFVAHLSGLLPSLKNREWEKFLSHLRFLVPIAVGVGLGLLLFSGIISYTLEYYFECTMYAFLGLMLGSLPSLFYKVGLSKEENPLIFLAFIAGFGIALFFSLGEGSFATSESGNANFFILAICGALAGGAMIIPGISGSFLLMILGVYETIVYTTASLLDFSLFLQNVAVLAPFAVGILVGILAVSKLMDFLLKKFYKQTFLCVVGFVVGSLPSLAVPFGSASIVASLAVCVVFAVLSFMLLKIKNK